MKPYVKPELYYENFELAQHIAGCWLSYENASGQKLSSPEHCTATGIIDGRESASWFLTEGICQPVLDDYCVTNGTINMATISS